VLIEEMPRSSPESFDFRGTSLLDVSVEPESAFIRPLFPQILLKYLLFSLA
jgi:hypothetical protein